jgi:hypothetical protein
MITEAVFDRPLKAAVIVTVWVVVTERVVAVNVAELPPEAMVTEAGTVRAELLLDDREIVELADAALVSDAVQMLVSPAVTVEGVQLSDDNVAGVTGAVSWSVNVLVVVLSVAVITAVESTEVDDAVALNEALLAPPGTVTESGTARLELLSDRETLNPLLGAAPLRVTVHPTVPGVVREAELQLKPLSATGGTNVTMAVADLVGSATLIALTVTVCCTLMLAGAV